PPRQMARHDVRMGIATHAEEGAVGLRYPPLPVEKDDADGLGRQRPSEPLLAGVQLRRGTPGLAGGAQALNRRGEQIRVAAQKIGVIPAERPRMAAVDLQEAIGWVMVRA